LSNITANACGFKQAGNFYSVPGTADRLKY
jgi:hypothetical protein